eukprot:COSAG05_NODE_9974_length_590_cov_0.600815_1_plen_46_part_10
MLLGPQPEAPDLPVLRDRLRRAIDPLLLLLLRLLLLLLLLLLHHHH